MIITILAAHDEASEYLQYFLSGSTLSWKTTNNTNTTNIRRREKSRNDVIITLRNNWIYILDVRKLRISFRNNVRSTVCVCVCVFAHRSNLVPPAPTVLPSILSLKSDFWPQVYALWVEDWVEWFKKFGDGGTWSVNLKIILKILSI